MGGGGGGAGEGNKKMISPCSILALKHFAAQTTLTYMFNLSYLTLDVDGGG